LGFACLALATFICHSITVVVEAVAYLFGARVAAHATASDVGPPASAPAALIANAAVSSFAAIDRPERRAFGACCNLK